MSGKKIISTASLLLLIIAFINSYYGIFSPSSLLFSPTNIELTYNLASVISVGHF